MTDAHGTAKNYDGAPKWVSTTDVTQMRAEILSAAIEILSRRLDRMDFNDLSIAHRNRYDVAS